MYFRILNFIFVFLFVSDFYSQSNDGFHLHKIPLKSHFSSEIYNGSIQNWSFDQDANGILYVANNEGLIEFDGNEWSKYKVPLSTKIRAVRVDHQNRVFVGGQNQLGYFKNTEKGFEFTSLIDNLEPNAQSIAEIWKIIEINKSIYFHTESKLLVYNGTEIRELNLPGYLQFLFKHKNKLIAQFYKKGLFELVNGEFKSIPETKLLPEIIGITESNDEDFYFSKMGVIFKSSKLNKPFKDYSKEFGSINVVIKLNNGGYAVGTQNNGLIILNSNFTIKHRFTKNNGLSGRTVKSVYEDGFHNLWVALNNGIDYLKMSLPFSLINEEVAIEGTGYAAHKFKDKIYLGTNNGVFTQNLNKSFKYPAKYNLLSGSEGQVWNFSQIDDELILNHNKGASMIRGSELIKFHNIGSWGFIKTNMPNMIIGGDYNGLKYFTKQNGKWTYKSNMPKLNESSRIIKFENDSTLWMTHGSKGAYKLQLDRNMQLKNDIQHFSESSGFPSNILITSYLLNGKLVFTSEKGVYNFNPETLNFTPNTFFNNMLGTDHISQIITDKSNSIYYIQNLEFGVLKEETYGKFKKETAIFKHINKFINDDLQNITILNEQNILIGAKEGFIHYNPLNKHDVCKDFSVIIKHITTTNSEDSTSIINPSFTKKLELDSNETIEINYASPYFDGFEDLTYSYRLTPLDENWSKWSSMSKKSYEHLPYGNYTFEVKALNLYGIESETSAFTFKVLAPWYASQAAKLGYIGLGLLSFILIPIMQRRKYKTERIIITEEKEKELKIKDEEIDKLNSEKLQTELDLKNDQLTSITMQLLKNKEFIQNVQEKISDTLHKGGSNVALKHLIKTIDQELSNNDSWDQFAYHFDQVHGNYLEKLSINNIRLSPREIKLAAFLRMNMSSKEIAKLLNITTRGVELARYRLRKKLNLNRDQNLVEYLIDLDNT